MDYRRSRDRARAGIPGPGLVTPMWGSSSRPRPAPPGGIPGRRAGSTSSSLHTSPPTPSSRASSPGYQGPRKVVIAVCGLTGAGKSSFIQKVSGKKMEIGHSLKSCTSKCQEVRCQIGQHQIILVDTPGFDDTSKSDVEILESIANWMSSSFHDDMLLSGLIYLHDIAKKRMGGSSMKNLRLFRQLCGEENLANVVLVTSMWDAVDPEVGRRMEKELMAEGEFWHPILEAGASAERYDNTITSAEKIIMKLVHNQRFLTNLQQEMIIDNKSLNLTSAGASINEELADLQRQHQEDLEMVREELEAAHKSHNKKLQAAWEARHEIMVKQLERTVEDQKRLNKDYENTNQQLTAKIQAQQDKHEEQLAKIEARFSTRFSSVEKQNQQQLTEQAEKHRQAMTTQQKELKVSFDKAMAETEKRHKEAVQRQQQENKEAMNKQQQAMQQFKQEFIKEAEEFATEVAVLAKKEKDAEVARIRKEKEKEAEEAAEAAAAGLIVGMGMMSMARDSERVSGRCGGLFCSNMITATRAVARSGVMCLRCGMVNRYAV